MKSADFPSALLSKQGELLLEDRIRGSRVASSSHRRMPILDRIPLIEPHD
jgi:hypothetical protein